jgi:proteic killer suppression protein
LARDRQYSIKINDPWRICFAWPDKSLGPTDAEIVDDH